MKNPLALALCLAAPAAFAVTTATVVGQTDTHPNAVSLSVGAFTGAADQSQPLLWAAASGEVANGFTDFRTAAEGRIDAGYTVVGLDGPTTLTFTWRLTGSRGWNIDNASFGGGVGAGIFNQVGAAYIHNIGWDISYVDGPPFMGDFAGVLSGPVRVTGQAGPDGAFGQVLPAGSWGGQGSVQAQTLWLLDSGWSGVLSLGAGISISGEVDTAYAISLVSVTRPQALGIASAAYLLLDNGTQIPITAVPEPGPGLLLLAGLATMAWRLRRAAR